MQNEKHAWQDQHMAKMYLEGIRGAIPLAAEQLDVILRIVHKLLPNIENIVDLGCGDGILGRTIMASWPDARATFVDFSKHMIEEASQKADSRRSSFIVQDLAEINWADGVRKSGPFDLVVSGLAIHHLTDDRKHAVYSDVFKMLKPGGLFLHLEHVASKSPWAREMFEELFVDYLWSYHKRQGGSKSRETVAGEYYGCPGHAANILAPVDLQCRWLGDIGFVDVDCFFKLFEIAIFGGRKPE
jgi:tRNA (cmo5U34)-methyltransferase